MRTWRVVRQLALVVLVLMVAYIVLSATRSTKNETAQKPTAQNEPYWCGTKVGLATVAGSNEKMLYMDKCFLRASPSEKKKLACPQNGSKTNFSITTGAPLILSMDGCVECNKNNPCKVLAEPGRMNIKTQGKPNS
ncbi:MAG: hypothetical protein ACD_76C00088G0004 [uncultured bacterium]|nr:MAG: hypothetical protein ACD_76C00088G0004 [uncultured bacterium]HBD05330.1 hypothetical protein [Candidatus Uhrbacteria bacterium]